MGVSKAQIVQFSLNVRSSVLELDPYYGLISAALILTVLYKSVFSVWKCDIKLKSHWSETELKLRELMGAEHFGPRFPTFYLNLIILCETVVVTCSWPNLPTPHTLGMTQHKAEKQCLLLFMAEGFKSV